MATKIGKYTKAEDIEHAKAWRSPFGRAYDVPNMADLVARQQALLGETTTVRGASVAIATNFRATHTPVPARTDRERRAAAVRERVSAAVAAAPVAVTRPAQQSAPVTPSPAEWMRLADELAMQLPAGRYALPRKEVTGNGNDITFFQVIEFKTGPRKGQRRIFQLIANGAGLGRQGLAPKLQVFAMRHILADVPSAIALYGQTIGKCSRCHRDLTNGESRAIGLGTECRKK
jgi:hypothetical protein